MPLNWTQILRFAWSTRGFRHPSDAETGQASEMQQADYYLRNAVPTEALREKVSRVYRSRASYRASS